MSDSKNTSSAGQEEMNERTSEPCPIPVKIVRKVEEEPVRVTDRRFWVQPEAGVDTEQQYSFKPSYVEQLETQVKESQKKLEETLNRYREFQADSGAELQRSKDRIQKEYNRRLSQARADVAGKFIDVLENFDRALAAAESAPSLEKLLQGVQLIHSQFTSTLAELGVHEIQLAGNEFNPEVAEAIGVVAVDEEDQDQKVLEVVSKGYRIEDILLRPARVKIGRCSSVSESSTGNA